MEKKGNILEGEVLMLFQLKGVGVPEVKSFGKIENYKILVETLLGDYYISHKNNICPTNLLINNKININYISSLIYNLGNNKKDKTFNKNNIRFYIYNYNHNNKKGNKKKFLFNIGFKVKIIWNEIFASD